MKDINLRVQLFDLHRLKQRGTLRGADSRQEYEYYVEHFLKNEAHMASLFQEFPELHRAMHLKEMQEAELRAEVYERLAGDKDEIIRTICHGQMFQGVTEIDDTIGDAHCGGKCAVRVTLDNGRILYYKPHSIRKSIAYQRLYQYICEKAYLNTIQIGYVDKGTYGWEEHVAYRECQSVEE